MFLHELSFGTWDAGVGKAFRYLFLDISLVVSYGSSTLMTLANLITYVEALNLNTDTLSIRASMHSFSWGTIQSIIRWVAEF